MMKKMLRNKNGQFKKGNKGFWLGKKRLSMIGHKWNNNRKFSEEHKRKIGKALKGRKLSEETKKKISNANKGKKSYNKGRLMSQKQKNKISKAHILRWNNIGRSLYYRNKHGGSKYIIWRLKVFERDGWICQFCGKRGYELNAHHIKSWIKYPKLRYKINNGITLCKEPCHRLANKEQRKVEKIKHIVIK